MLRTKVEKTNPIAFNMIKNAVIRNRVSHAFLFSAPKNYTINNEWKLLVESLISEKPFTDFIRDIDTYPDLHIIDGSKDLIKKEQVIIGVDKMQQTPLENNGKKIMVINNIDNANKQSLNSLLKFIEEPTKDTYIIMTTNNISKVLTTIKSRAQIISLKPLPFLKMKELLSKDYKNDAAIIARLIGDIKEADEANKNLKKYKEQFIEILDEAITNNRKFYNPLMKLIDKNNALFILNLARIFFNDIWRKSEDFEIVFPEDLVNKYVLADFDFATALEITNDFIVSRENNVNFNLYKSQALIRIGECYE